MSIGYVLRQPSSFGYFDSDSELYRLTNAVAATIFFFSGLTDLPRSLQVGPVTSQAILTILYFIAALLLVITTPVSESRDSRKTWLLTAFVLWAATSLVWSPARVGGGQNILVLATLTFLLFASEATARAVPGFAIWAERQMERSVLLASAVYASTLLLVGAANDAVFSARSYGLFAVYGVACHLGRWRYGRRSGLWWAILLTCLIGASESRLALGIALVLFPLSQLPTRGFRGWIKVIALSAVVVATFWAAFAYFDGLRDRFLKGDVSMNVGLFEINGSGRTAFWRAILDSSSEAPWVGKGAGSSEDLIESMFITIKHPHNDYLRIVHDYGIIGLLLWAGAIFSLLVSLWRRWSRSDGVSSEQARVHLTGVLLTFAFILQMTMENAIVSIFVIAPLGLMLGSALGSNATRIPYRVQATRA